MMEYWSNGVVGCWRAGVVGRRLSGEDKSRDERCQC